MLPQLFNSGNIDGAEDEPNSEKELVRILLAELERLLIHANIRVSFFSFFPISCIHINLILFVVSKHNLSS